jgi:hypothetical protein
MHDELYADGVGEITITGSVVRINLMSLSATAKDEHDNPRAIFRQRVIMPVEAFANAVDLMQKALAGLIEAGAIRRVPPLAKPADLATPPGETPAPPGPNASPNFN